ncbi:MAG: hypothetical protein OXG72_10160 [Acidobacteria bacterium]|nr:hypothetical protein [Acidobacteriota bacterium]
MLWNRRRSQVTVPLGLLLVVTVVPVRGQPKSAGEISSGYQLHHAVNSRAVPRGWFVSGGPYVTAGIAVIGEVARSHGSRAVAGVPGIGPEASGDETTYMAGVLWRRPARSVTVFARFLVGARRLAVHRDLTGTAAGWSTVGSAIQAGGGVDIPFTARSAVRLAGTYLRLPSDDVGGHAARLAIGTVYRFGH